jgi:hypothetical protein
MIARATGLFTIYRGTTENASGDEVAADYIVASDVPLALHNGTAVEYSPTTFTPRTITTIRGRATGGTDLRVEDRIKNQSSDQRYVVDTVVEPLSSTRLSDLSFSCHRVN